MKESFKERDSKSQLAVALYENDDEVLTKVKSENLIPEDVWNTALWALKQ